MPEDEVHKTMEYFLKGNGRWWCSLGQKKLIEHLGGKKRLQSGCSVRLVWGVLLWQCRCNKSWGITCFLCLAVHWGKRVPPQLICWTFPLTTKIRVVPWMDLQSVFCSFIRIFEFQIIFRFCTVLKNVKWEVFLFGHKSRSCIYGPPWQIFQKMVLINKPLISAVCSNTACIPCRQNGSCP